MRLESGLRDQALASVLHDRADRPQERTARPGLRGGHRYAPGGETASWPARACPSGTAVWATPVYAAPGKAHSSRARRHGIASAGPRRRRVHDQQPSSGVGASRRSWCLWGACVSLPGPGTSSFPASPGISVPSFRRGLPRAGRRGSHPRSPPLAPPTNRPRPSLSRLTGAFGCRVRPCHRTLNRSLSMNCLRSGQLTYHRQDRGSLLSPPRYFSRTRSRPCLIQCRPVRALRAEARGALRERSSRRCEIPSRGFDPLDVWAAREKARAGRMPDRRSVLPSGQCRLLLGLLLGGLADVRALGALGGDTGDTVRNSPACRRFTSGRRPLDFARGPGLPENQRFK
jgi:hypothetical protein